MSELVRWKIPFSTWNAGYFLFLHSSGVVILRHNILKLFFEIIEQYLCPPNKCWSGLSHPIVEFSPDRRLYWRLSWLRYVGSVFMAYWRSRFTKNRGLRLNDFKCSKSVPRHRQWTLYPSRTKCSLRKCYVKYTSHILIKSVRYLLPHFTVIQND